MNEVKPIKLEMLNKEPSTTKDPKITKDNWKQGKGRKIWLK